jgi:Photosynthetic reaction centre cytochrome C subunit
MTPRRTLFAALPLAVLAAGAQRPAAAQDLPAQFKNLQVLPKTITKPELKALMEGFTDQLDVKCTFCHILDEYDKDDLKHKRDARRMIQLVQHLRGSLDKYFKAGVEERQINCWMCHRGKSEPDEYVPE